MKKKIGNKFLEIVVVGNLVSYPQRFFLETRSISFFSFFFIMYHFFFYYCLIIFCWLLSLRAPDSFRKWPFSHHRPLSIQPRPPIKSVPRLFLPDPFRRSFTRLKLPRLRLFPKLPLNSDPPFSTRYNCLIRLTLFMSRIVLAYTCL